MTVLVAAVVSALVSAGVAYLYERITFDRRLRETLAEAEVTHDREIILGLDRVLEKVEPERLKRLDELMFRSTAFGFITDTVMIAAGSIWAKDLWGSYWSWDPVETWSLLSWLVYGVSLHLRITLGWRGRRLAWLLVFAIIGVLISFWGVNLVMEGSAHVFNVG